VVSTRGPEEHLRANDAGTEALEGHSPRRAFATIGPAPILGLRIAELWHYRDLLLTLALRNIQIRYKQALLGGLWAVLQPTASAVLFAVVFGRFLDVKADAETPYLLFAYTGMLAWLFFAAIVSGAAVSLVDNAYLVTKVYFPRILVPASVAGYALLDLLVAVPVLLLLMIHYDRLPGTAVLLAVPVLLGILVCGLGAGVMLSALTVKYRDFRFVMPFLLQLWLFSSPVVYPPSAVPEKYRDFMALNPMYGLLGALRTALLDAPFDARSLGISALVAVTTSLLGLCYFRRVEDEFADIV
jgi:lipopolysaccharide transport system permease protein